MNIKLWLNLFLAGCLGSCVVIDERYFDYHIHMTDSKHVEHTVNTSSPTTPAPPSKIDINLSQSEPTQRRPGISCAPFSSPPREKLPSVPDFENTDVDLETQIAGYINSLYATIHKERQALDQAIALHLESCVE